MAKKSVLAVGIEPSLADYTQIERLRALDYDVESCLIDLGET
jgi:hypothetical protein